MDYPEAQFRRKILSSDCDTSQLVHTLMMMMCEYNHDQVYMMHQTMLIKWKNLHLLALTSTCLNGLPVTLLVENNK